MASTNFEDLILRGLAASRPAASIPGRLYFATDTQVTSRDNGATWDSFQDAAASTLPVGKTLFVDSVNGNDGSAIAGRLDKPYAKISTAVAAASSGDRVIVGPGTFTETTAIQLPANVSLFGSGMDVTKLVNSTTGIGGNHAVLAPGTNSIIADLTVDNSGVSTACPMGGLSSDTAFTNAIVQRVKLIGSSDAFYFDHASALSLTAYDCVTSVSTTTSSADSVIVVSATTGTFRFYNCRFSTSSTSIASRGITLGTGASTLQMFGGSIDVAGSATNTNALTNGGTLELHDVTLTRASAGNDLERTGGTLAINNVVRSDGAALATSGTITRLVGVYTGNLASAAVTLPKIQNATANSKVLGSGDTGSGSAYSELSLGAGLSIAAGAIFATGGGGSSVTSTELSAVSAQAASAINVVSARAVSISAELASLVQVASAAATSANTHANTVSARAVSISAELASLVQIASAAATSADTHANTVSARVVSVSAEVVSLMNSIESRLSARIDLGGGTASVTSTEVSAVSAQAASAINVVSARAVSISAELASLVQVASLAATSADGHANTVSARAVSISNELGSLMASLSANLISKIGVVSLSANAISARVVSVSNELGSLVQIASLAATSADTHANTVSARAVSISAELASLVQIASAAATSVNARLDNLSAMSGADSVEGLQSVINALSNRISAGGGGGGSVTSAEVSVISARVVSVSAELASLIQGYSTTSATSTTTPLSAGSPPEEFFTGTDTQHVLMPDVTTLVLGKQYLIKNNSVGDVTVKSSGGNTIVVVKSGKAAVLTCILTTGTGTASWDYTYSGDANADAVSARVVSVSAELASLVQIASAAATSVNSRLDAVSALSGADSVEGLQSVIDLLSNRISAAGGGGGSVTSTELSVVNARMDNVSAMSAVLSVVGLQTVVDALSTAISVVSARNVSVSNELGSLLASATPLKAVNTADQASITVSTGLTVSGVSIALTAGNTYAFEFMIPFRCNIASGVVVGVVSPAANRYFANYQIPGAVGTTGVAPATNAVTPFHAQVRAVNTKVSTTSITLTGVTLMAYAWGTINPSAGGSIKFVIGPNTSGGANSGVVPLQGANVKVTRLA